jgi:hypothetical protein
MKGLLKLFNASAVAVSAGLSSVTFLQLLPPPLGCLPAPLHHAAEQNLKELLRYCRRQRNLRVLPDPEKVALVTITYKFSWNCASM